MNSTTLKNHNASAPSAELLNWLSALPGLPGRLSGQTLKFILSRLPAAVFIVSPEEHEILKDLGNGEIAGLLNQKSREGETTWILDLGGTFETGQEAQYHCLFRSSPEKIRPIISVDRLVYDTSSGWTGSESDLADLEKGILRPLDSADCGPLEILNICALSAQLDFEIVPEIMREFGDTFRQSDISHITRKQQSRIFRKIVLGSRPSRGFLSLDEAGALDWLLPELAAGKGLLQNRFHRYDIFYHSIYSCDAVREPDLKLRLSALFHDLGKVQTRREKPNGEASFHNHEAVSARHADRIMRRFDLDPWLGKRVKFLVRNHMFHYTAEWTDKAVRRFIQKIEPDILADLISLRLADRKGSGKRTALPQAIKDMMKHIENVRAREAELKIRDLAVNGHTLMELGLQPGPLMGNILREILEKVKSGELVNDAEILKNEAMRKIGDGR